MSKKRGKAGRNDRILCINTNSNEVEVPGFGSKNRIM